MVRIATLLTRTLGAAALCALLLAACGGARPRTTTAGAAAQGATKPQTHDDYTVYLYSSLPRRGPQRRASLQTQQGIRLALALLDNHKVGSFRVRYRALSASAPHRSGWSPEQTVENAEKVAANPQAVAYIGELDSDATKLSLPILNQAGIAQITPGSPYPGLTDGITLKGFKITGSDEPTKYYPQHTQTLLRLIPNDLVQASAVLLLLQKAGCHAAGVWQFGGGSDAAALLVAIKAYAAHYHITVPTLTALPKPSAHTKDYYTYAVNLKGKIGCAVLTGRATRAAVAFTTELRDQALVPGGLAPGTIVGTSGLCNAGWTDFRRGGVQSQVAASLYCTTPIRPMTVKNYHGSAAFIAAFRRHHHHRRPSTYAYLGYEAAEMVFTAMNNLGNGLDNRSTLMSSLLDGADRSGALGNNFDPNGNLRDWAYGVEKVDSRTHAPVFYETLEPTYVPSSEG